MSCFRNHLLCLACFGCVVFPTVIGAARLTFHFQLCETTHRAEWPRSSRRDCCVIKKAKVWSLQHIQCVQQQPRVLSWNKLRPFLLPYSTTLWIRAFGKYVKQRQLWFGPNGPMKSCHNVAYQTQRQGCLLISPSHTAPWVVLLPMLLQAWCYDNGAVWDLDCNLICSLPSVLFIMVCLLWCYTDRVKLIHHLIELWRLTVYNSEYLGTAFLDLKTFFCLFVCVFFTKTSTNIQTWN